MFEKDTLRLIGKSLKRFISLVMIVMIGAGFMMGLFSSRRIMEESVDRYNDRYDLQDIQLYSSYGFDAADMKALRAQEWVSKCFASRMADVYSRSEDGEAAVTRLEETDRAVNRFEIIEGRMPKNSSEALVLNNSLSGGGYRIGEEITLFLEDSDILDSVECDKVKIVGVVKAPAYMAKTLGTSILKNLELEQVLYLLPSAFKSDYYTTVYITVNGAKDLDGFSKQYDSHIEEIKTDINVFSRKQSAQLKEKLVDEYTRKIEESEQELEGKKLDAQMKLDEAQKQLEDANIQLIASQAQIDSLSMALRQGTERLNLLEAQYDERYAGLDDEIAEIEQAYGGRSFESIYSEVLSDYGTYNALKTMTDPSGTAVIDAQISDLEADNASRRQRLNSELYPKRSELQAIIADENSSEMDKTSAASELTFIEQSISEEIDAITLNERLISSLREMKKAGSSGSAASRMAEIDARYNGSVENEYRRLTRISRDRVAWETIENEMSIARQGVERVSGQIDTLRIQINAGRAQYEAGYREYQKNLIEFTEQMEKAEAEIRKAYQELEELPDAEWMILTRDKQYTSYLYANNAKQMGAIGVSLPVLFFLVAALVCLTTMTRLVDEQRGQIGIFRALGFSKAAVVMRYVVYALLASISGCFIGVFAGMAVFPTVIYRTWRLLYDLPDMAIMFPVGNALLCFTAFSALMAGVTAAVVGKTLKDMPSQLMRPKAPRAAKTVFLEKIPFIWRKLSFTGKITARNIIRYKARFLMTVIGVAGCTGLLVMGWGIKDSIKDVVHIQFGEIMNYDYMIKLENDHSIDEMVEILEDDLSNQYVTPYMSYSTKIYLDGEEGVLEAQVMDARKGNDIYQLRGLDHYTPLRLSTSGVIVSEKFAKNNGLREGDYVTIESARGLKAEIKIVSICEMYFQHYVFISSDLYESVFGEPMHPNTIGIKSSCSIEELENELSEFENVESIIDFSSITKQFDTMIRALDLIIIVIILTAGALAFVVLINLTQVNISERIREIATLKVLGFRQGEVESYLFKEILILSFIGALAGMPLGIAEHHFIMNIISMEMMMFGRNIKPLSFVYGVGITIVFTLIVLVMTKGSLRRIEMIESLKSVE